MRHIHQVATCEKLSVLCMLPHWDSLAEHGERIRFAGMMFSSCPALLRVSLCTVPTVRCVSSELWAQSPPSNKDIHSLGSGSGELQHEVREQSWGCFSDTKGPGTACFIAMNVSVPCSHIGPPVSLLCIAPHALLRGRQRDRSPTRMEEQQPFRCKVGNHTNGYVKFRRLLLN